jgi:hypothetical protein
MLVCCKAYRCTQTVLAEIKLFFIFLNFLKTIYYYLAEISIIIVKLNSEVIFTVQFEPQNMPNPWTYGI